MEKEWVYMEYQKPEEKVDYTDIHQPWLEAVQHMENISVKEGWLTLHADYHVEHQKK